MMYFSCRKPHHSCYLHCVKETPSSPFTEVGEGKTPQTGLARIRTFPGFTLDCVKNLASAGAMQLIWLSFSQSEERLRCPAGLGGVPGQPVLSCTAQRLLRSPAGQGTLWSRSGSQGDLQLCLSPPLCSPIHHRHKSTADLELSLPVLFRLLGLRMSLSSMLTICPNLGLSLRSFCQQSSISWWRAMGQSIGGGNRYPSSMALITCKWHN